MNLALNRKLFQPTLYRGMCRLFGGLPGPFGAAEFFCPFRLECPNPSEGVAGGAYNVANALVLHRSKLGPCLAGRCAPSGPQGREAPADVIGKAVLIGSHQTVRHRQAGVHANKRWIKSGDRKQARQPAFRCRAAGFAAFFCSTFLPLIGSSISRWPSARFFAFLGAVFSAAMLCLRSSITLPVAR